MIRFSKTHVLRILDANGDERIIFHPEKPVEVRDVEARFQELMERGFVAFDVSTKPGRVIKRFDPQAAEVIVTPHFAGG